MVKMTITGFAGRDTEKHGKVSCNSISAGARISGTKDASGKYEYMNDWYDVIAFGKELEDVKKGTKVEITGTLEYNKYVDKNGNDKITKRLIVETVNFPK